MVNPAALVLFAHGARDPEWALPFHDIAAQLGAVRSDLTVKLSFLEFQPPALKDAIAELVATGHRSIHIAPLFMAQGGHLKHDVPELLTEIRRDNPALKLELLPAIGDVAALRASIAGWLAKSIPQAAA